MKKLLLFASLLLILSSTEALGQNEIKYIDHTVSGTGISTKVTAIERSISSGYIVGDDLADLVGGDQNVYIQDKTVVITKNHLFNNPIVIWGTVNFILCDGVTMTCNKMINVASGHKLNIYGQEQNSGKLVVTGTDYNAGIGSIENVYAGTINIHGGTIEATGGSRGAGIGGGNHRGFDVRLTAGGLTIYDGKVTATGGKYGAGIGSGNGLDSDDAHSGYVTIYGGTISATGGTDAAGVGGGDGGHGTMFSMYGGSLTAISARGDEEDNDGGAGIGGGYDGNSGAISIYAGTINATATPYGAGIGSGTQGTASQICIYGGDITATGGRSGGAGIGSGQEGLCRDITISGGTIHATGRYSGAGIGGGRNSDNTADTPMNITITGGENITAVSDDGGAGIGCGGASVFYGTINISGGTIHATGGEDGGAGIGGGCNYQEYMYGDIIISGGTIEATGRSGAGIGCGGGFTRINKPGRIVITGGTITATTDNGAAIGGGGHVTQGSLEDGYFDNVGAFYGTIAISGNPTLILKATERRGRAMRYDVDLNGEGDMTLTGKLAVSTGGTVCAADQRISTLTSVREARIEPCTHSSSSTFTINDASTHGYTNCEYCATNGTSENHIFDNDHMCFCGLIQLMDNESNARVLDFYKNSRQTVFLDGRTLYKDNSWNTLCLPFSLRSFTGTPLEGATVKELSSADFNSNTGTLTLNFSDDLTSIEAGKPYIVKWAASTPNTIENPLFKSITIYIPDYPTNITDVITFQGIYSPFDIPGEDKKLLYLGADNKLYYPNAGMTINAFRAYFQLQGDLECQSASTGINNFVLNFGGESSIENIPSSFFHLQSEGWYTLDGRKLSGKPMVKGIYINNGHKLVIK